MTARELRDLMARQRGGHRSPEFEWIAELDPEFMAAYNTMAAKAFGLPADGPDNHALSRKTKELIALAMLTGQRDWERTPTHLRRLIALGASDREILEALETAATIAGGPAMRGGVEILLRIRSDGDAAAEQ